MSAFLADVGASRPRSPGSSWALGAPLQTPWLSAAGRTSLMWAVSACAFTSGFASSFLPSSVQLKAYLGKGARGVHLFRPLPHVHPSQAHYTSCQLKTFLGLPTTPRMWLQVQRGWALLAWTPLSHLQPQTSVKNKLFFFVSCHVLWAKDLHGAHPHSSTGVRLGLVLSLPARLTLWGLPGETVYVCRAVWCSA